jgi:hypothetical protein
MVQRMLASSIKCSTGKPIFIERNFSKSGLVSVYLVDGIKIIEGNMIRGDPNNVAVLLMLLQKPL